MAHAGNNVFASGGVDVRFESVVLFSYFITWEKAQVLTPRPNANTGRWQQPAIRDEVSQRLRNSK